MRTEAEVRAKLAALEDQLQTLPIQKCDKETAELLATIYKSQMVPLLWLLSEGEWF